MKNNELESRRRERIRNLLNQCQLLFMDNGSDKDLQVFEALKEAVREDITLEELEALRADNMLLNPAIPFSVHPFTFIVKINKEFTLDGWWYKGFEGTLTVRSCTDDWASQVRKILGVEYTDLFIVDNGKFQENMVLKKHCILV